MSYDNLSAQLTKIYHPLPTSVQPISITKTLWIVLTKNERDPPLFTGKLLMDEEDNVPDKPQTKDIDPLNCKGDNSKPDSNMDADIEFIQKESNKSSETENKDFAENKV
jgi:hypothetical protein